MTKQFDNIMTFILILAFGLLINIVLSSCQTAQVSEHQTETRTESVQIEAGK